MYSGGGRLRVTFASSKSLSNKASVLSVNSDLLHIAYYTSCYSSGL